MEINFLALVVAAASTFVVGFIYYNPKVFGSAWMTAAGLTEEKVKAGNIVLIFGLSFLFAFMISMEMQFLTIHQTGAISMVGGDPSNALPSFQAFMDDYGNVYRTFKHGALHGFLASLFFAFPMIATIGLFERKSWKYILINSGYWVICLTLIGAIVCGWK